MLLLFVPTLPTQPLVPPLRRRVWESYPTLPRLTTSIRNCGAHPSYSSRGSSIKHFEYACFSLSQRGGDFSIRALGCHCSFPCIEKKRQKHILFFNLDLKYHSIRGQITILCGQTILQGFGETCRKSQSFYTTAISVTSFPISIRNIWKTLQCLRRYSLHFELVC